MFTLVRALVWTTLVTGFGFVFLPSRILARAGVTTPDSVGPIEWTAIALTLTGALLVLSCVLTFVFVGKGTSAPYDPPTRLVTSGPYGFVRNPIYIGAILVVGGTALYYGSGGVALYALALTIGFHVLVILYEEPTLRRSFGDSYVAYCERVPRWLPRLARR